MSDTSEARRYCALPPQPVRELPPGMPHDRQRAILLGAGKWVNGTTLHYTFLEGPEDQRAVVRESFAAWKALPIGLNFAEVPDRTDSEVRIGFDQSDGSWSYVGRQILEQGVNKPTMNFGWDLTSDYGHTTALHEIGHTVGLPHEHQNPFAGIVWDEPAVYAYFAGDPHFWPRDQTFHNVLRKLSAAEVSGSSWDPDSVMEYDFPPGLIKEPAPYRNGIHPPGGLSPVDQEWARKWYPGEAPPAERRLEPFKSLPLGLQPAEQADLVIVPPATRRYKIATFGTADTVMVLFEDDHGELRYLKGADDSGTDTNASLSWRLFKGRRYVLKVRLYWAGDSGETAVMYW
jgi:Astacin (Peptidase family M12A)